MAVVKDSTGTVRTAVEVPKRKYYILMTMDNFLVLFKRPEIFKILKELIDILAELVGPNNVVWISPPVNGTEDKRHSSNKRQPKMADFINAHNDTEIISKYDKILKYNPNRGVIFNYGHGNEKEAGLVFSGQEYLLAKKIEALVPEGNRRKLSKNYVCYQKKTSYFFDWKLKLPYMEFYSEYRINESLAAQLFLNHLVDEINGIHPGTHNIQYKFICNTRCKYQANRCKDIVNCKDPVYREGKNTRIGWLVEGKFICESECINKDKRCENISQCKDEKYRYGKMDRFGWLVNN
jgi:hypothetical protein